MPGLSATNARIGHARIHCRCLSGASFGSTLASRLFSRVCFYTLSSTPHPQSFLRFSRDRWFRLPVSLSHPRKGGSDELDNQRPSS